MTELTAEIVSKLSPGASKLYLATLVEPGESDAHYRAVTSYKPRWYKKLRGELVEAGLVDSDVQELSVDQQRAEAELRSLGIDGSAVAKFACSCPPETVQSVVSYVRGRSDIANPAGYAIRILRERLKEGSNTPNVPRNEPFRGDMQKRPTSPEERTTAPSLSQDPLHRGDLQKGPESTVAAPMPHWGRTPPVGALVPRACVPVGQAPGMTAEMSCDQAERENKVTQQRALDGAMLDTDFQLLLYGVCAACGCDPLLRPQTLDDVERLYLAGYRVADVQRFISDVWPTCWPGNKGERATLKALLDYIGFTKHSAPASDGSAYLADPYFADHPGCPWHKEEEGSLPDFVKYETNPCQHCGQVVCQCTPIPAHVETVWRAALEALRTHFQDGDHRISLSHVSPVAYTNGVLRLSVPGPVKDWFERKVLPVLRLWCRSRQDGGIEIELVESLDRADWPAVCADCGHHPCRCREIAIPIRVRTMWQATLGQLQVQLKRSTYETWLRDVHLAAFEDNQVKVEVPHAYAKDWIDRHLLPSLERSFNEIYRGEQAVTVVVEIAPRDD